MQKPEITIPAEDPPAELVIDDITVGDGDEAVAGKGVTVHYAGVSWSTGVEFDASWNRMEPFKFGLGPSQVIQGWDEGVQGMKVGGRRRLTIPPSMGYGAAGAGGVIAGNETLVFVVDLLAVG
jgi:peptidylprolyl isomerase